MTIMNVADQWRLATTRDLRAVMQGKVALPGDGGYAGTRQVQRT
jgi:hypothetical protein